MYLMNELMGNIEEEIKKFINQQRGKFDEYLTRTEILLGLLDHQIGYNSSKEFLGSGYRKSNDIPDGSPLSYKLPESKDCDLLVRDNKENVNIIKEKKKNKSEINKSINELNLSVRSVNCLTKERIKTIQNLIGYCQKCLIKLPHFGMKSLREIKEVLDIKGYALSTKKDCKCDFHGKK